MSDKPTLQQLLEIQEFFGLPSPALVDKDWHVVRALAAIANADTAPFQLVFGGGTALSRAFGLLRRMSEDIDLRIIGRAAPTRAELRQLRETLTEALLAAGFAFDPTNEDYRRTMYEGRYTIYHLPYAPVVEGGAGILRPEIQIETTLSPLRWPGIEKPVSSFLAEAYKQPPELAAILCASVPETAAEKFVALGRRAGSELAGIHAHDATLVRHIHDLHVIREQYETAVIGPLALEIAVADAATRARDYPDYQNDPVGQTVKAVTAIAGSKQFADEYATFVRDMVYGEAPDFETALGTLQLLAKKLHDASRNQPPRSM